MTPLPPSRPGLLASALAAALLVGHVPGPAAAASADLGLANAFSRIATFNICEQMDPACNVDNATNAETISYYESDGATVLVYSDSSGAGVGFVDVTDPAAPKADGVVDLPGEPTTVTVVDDKYAVVGVNTSPDYVNPSGVLAVIDIATKSILREIVLPGQPDSVAATSSHIAIAIENERDEDLGEGTPPQLPAGELSIVDVVDLDDPATWTVRSVSMLGLDGCRFPEDPEPEYVHIDDAGEKVVVTLQENNCVAIVDLASGEVLASADVGSSDLTNVDATGNDVVNQTESGSFLREPDGVAWIGDTGLFATANEGDMDGGSRGWSVFDSAASPIAPVWDSGNEMELWTVRMGHYPEARSGKKGNEPENLLYAKMGNGKAYIFVLSERSSVVFVYDVTDDPKNPKLIQILPVGTAPEGVVVVPSKNILAIASEEDAREDKIRSSITIFALNGEEDMGGDAQYPTLVSAASESNANTYIPFSALSGLASAYPPNMDADAAMENILYTVEDSFYQKNRILTIDASEHPAVVKDEMRITDPDGVLAACLSTVEAFDATATTVVNDDDTVNIDPEGIACASEGGFWVVSEGKGTVGDEAKPFATPNMLLKLADDATIEECVLLPQDGTFEPQLRFGFEGVAEDGGRVVVATQRAWGEDDHPRLSVYDPSSKSWKHAFYPLDAPASQNGGWVGLSDVSPLGAGQFLVLERDNQGGPDAAIKRLYRIDLGDYSFEDGTAVEKELFLDLMPALTKTNGQVLEKVEGLAVTKSGDVWINTDNDGVDDSSGEQVLLKVGTIELPKIPSEDDEPNDDSSGVHGSLCAAMAIVFAAMMALF